MSHDYRIPPVTQRPARPSAEAKAVLIAFVEALARNQARLDAIEAGEACLEDFISPRDRVLKRRD